MAKILLYILFLLPFNPCFSQSDTLNQMDSNGVNIGYWEMYYHDLDSVLYAKGNLYGSEKVGEWSYYSENGNIKSTFSYLYEKRRSSKRQGDYKLYYPNGCFMEKGRLTQCVYHFEMGSEGLEMPCNEGQVLMYYKDTCNTLMYKRMFKSGKQIWIIKYERNGTVIDTIFEDYGRNLNLKNANDVFWEDDTSAVESRTIHPSQFLSKDGRSYEGGVSDNGNNLKPNGYNRVYDLKYNLWLDGEFIYGYLFNGKCYVYNEEGILIKIEIWKNGKLYLIPFIKVISADKGVGMMHSSVNLNIDTLNQIDSTGKKQSYWILYGIDKPEKSWCDSCKIEEGRYLNNRKDGDWIKYYQDGVTPKLKVAYTLGRPSGYYTKYHLNGNIKESGNFFKRKHIGDRIVYYESGCVQMEQNYDENGKLDGIQTYYYNNCTPPDSIRGQVDVQQKMYYGVHKEIIRFYPNGDKKEIITYAENGTILKTEKFEETKAPYVKGKVAKTNSGYHPVYPDDELYEDGEFRNGKLWNGKKYIYDADGILIKVEIWKKGKYHSDGQL